MSVTRQIANQWIKCLRLAGPDRFFLKINKKWQIDLSKTLKPNLGGLHQWTSKAGYYKTATLKDCATGREREFHVYFGGWSGRNRNSSYVVIFDARKPILEVPVYNRRLQRLVSRRGYPITKNLDFRGVQKQRPASLCQQALKLSKQAGLTVNNQKVELGTLPKNGHLGKRQAKQILRSIITCAYAKTYVKRDSPFRRFLAGGLTINPFKPKTVKGGKRGTILVKRKLEKQYGSFKRHERLVECLAGKLTGAGLVPLNIRFSTCDFDLAAEKKKRQTGFVFEVKAWKSQYHIQAARHAFGQVQWYLWQLSKRNKRTAYRGCVVLDHKPVPEIIDFLESKGVLAVWFVGLTPDGGNRAKREIPELF